VNAVIKKCVFSFLLNTVVLQSQLRPGSQLEENPRQPDLLTRTPNIVLFSLTYDDIFADCSLERVELVSIVCHVGNVVRTFTSVYGVCDAPLYWRDVPTDWQLV